MNGGLSPVWYVCVYLDTSLCEYCISLCICIPHVLLEDCWPLCVCACVCVCVRMLVVQSTPLCQILSLVFSLMF